MCFQTAAFVKPWNRNFLQKVWFAALIWQAVLIAQRLSNTKYDRKPYTVCVRNISVLPWCLFRACWYRICRYIFCFTSQKPEKLVGMALNFCHVTCSAVCNVKRGSNLLPFCVERKRLMYYAKTPLFAETKHFSGWICRVSVVPYSIIFAMCELEV